MSIRLLIADYQELARVGIKQFLAGTDIQVVAETDTAEGAVEAVETVRPDVVLLAVRFPSGDGLRALNQIKLDRPDLPVVMTSTEDNPVHFAKAHAFGAAGLLLKDFTREGLVSAIRRAAAGESLWTRACLRRVSAAVATGPSNADLEACLTRREQQVLALVADGLTNTQIAKRLNISHETVKEHVQHILRKIGVGDRTQAALWALRKGLV